MKAVVVLCCLLAACSSIPSKESAPVAPPTTVVDPPILRTVEVKTSPRPWGNPETTVQWTDRTFRIYDGQAKLKEASPEEQRMYGFGPVVEIRKGQKKRILDLRDEAPKDLVSHVFHDPVNRKIWVLTEYGVEGPSPTYSVWISEDGGETWFRGGDLRRPGETYPPSDLVTLWVDGEGRGEALFSLETALSGEAQKNAKRGSETHFRSVTRDGGRSWSVDPEPLRWNGMIKAK